MTREEIDAPKYPVGTLVEMARIPEEALPRFLAELPVMLRHIRPMIELQDAINKAVGSEALDIKVPGVWIDDDKRTYTTSVIMDGEELLSATGKFELPEQSQ